MDDETRKKMNVEETFAAIDKIIGRLEKGALNQFRAGH